MTLAPLILFLLRAGVVVALWFYLIVNALVACCCRRHRIFESGGGLCISGVPCNHDEQPAPIDVSGVGYHQYSERKKKTGGKCRKPRNLAHCRQIMNMPWASREEIAQAIPPAFSEFLGIQVRNHLERMKTITLGKEVVSMIDPPNEGRITDSAGNCYTIGRGGNGNIVLRHGAECHPEFTNGGMDIFTFCEWINRHFA